MDSLEKKIIDYCDGSLSAKERAEFEIAMQKDATLKKQVEDQQEILLALESKEFLDLLPKAQTKTKIKRIGYRRFILPALAAAAVALFLIFRPGLFTGNPLNEIFYSDPGLITPMSSVSEYDFYDGMVEYKVGNYHKALAKWTGSPTGIGQDTLTYYQAMAHLGLNDYDKAFELLDGLKNSNLSTKSVWYQIYILLKQERKSEAQSMFKSLSKEAPNYDQLAQYFQGE